MVAHDLGREMIHLLDANVLIALGDATHARATREE